MKNKKAISRNPLFRASIILLILSWTFLSFAEAHENINQKLKSLRAIRGTFTFAVLGDNRGGGNEYETITRRMMEHQPAFVVNTGDMIGATNKKQWAYFREKSKAVTVPYFLAVGNHDAYDEESETLYKKEVDLPGNELYYSFVVSDSLFIVLDSSIPGHDRDITDGQFQWLKSVLSKSRGKHKFVFLHHPLYPDQTRGLHFGESLDFYPAERDRLERLFEKYKVNIVFTGHEHLYLRKMVNGVAHITTGGAGAPLYTEVEKGGFHHFLLVTVKRDGVRGQVIDDRGIVRDSFEFKN